VSYAWVFKNRVAMAIGMLLVIAVGLVVLQRWCPGAVMVPITLSTRHEPHWALSVAIMAFGAVGGLLTAFPALTRVPWTRNPFAVPTHQALLRLILGSLTAVVGLMTINVAGTNTSTEIFSLAVAFGAVTHFVHQRAKAVLVIAAKASTRQAVPGTKFLLERGVFTVPREGSDPSRRALYQAAAELVGWPALDCYGHPDDPRSRAVARRNHRSAKRCFLRLKRAEGSQTAAQAHAKNSAKRCTLRSERLDGH